MNFAKSIIREKIDITWVCFARIDFTGEEMLRLMKKAGAIRCFMG